MTVAHVAVRGILRRLGEMESRAPARYTVGTLIHNIRGVRDEAHPAGPRLRAVGLTCISRGAS